MKSLALPPQLVLFLSAVALAKAGLSAVALAKADLSTETLVKVGQFFGRSSKSGQTGPKDRLNQ